MKNVSMMVMLLACSSCAMLSLSKSAYEYDIDPGSKNHDKDAVLQVTDFEQRQLGFELQNTGDQSLKIIWDDSVLVDASGNAHKLIHKGVKFIKAGEPMAPTLVPASAKVDDIVGYADGLIPTSSGDWLMPQLVECDGGALCDKSKYYGKNLTLVLAVEQAGKRKEYSAKLRLRAPASAPK